MMMRPNRIVIGIGVALLIVGVAGALFFDEGGERSGVGPFAAEMARCRDRIFQDLRYPEFIEYVEASVWHAGGRAAFTLGGIVRLRGSTGQPFNHSYECGGENGRILRVEVR